MKILRRGRPAWVAVKPQRGSYVFEASEADVAALCECRCVMEPRAAELAYVFDRRATIAARIAALRTHLSAPANVLRPLGIDQHKQMLELFSAGDFPGFDALMREHVNGTRLSYIASLKARSLAAAKA